MLQNKISRLCRIGLVSVFIIIGAPRPGATQITPDNTLGPETSVVGNGVVEGNDVQLIEGGATRGSNLFHSFRQFNIGMGEEIYFASPNNIDNILSRVTGNSLSIIDGVLGVDGPANLFFLNPNGIIFGPEAQLNIGGSFTASTADSLNFADSTKFSTDISEAALLSVSVPLGLQLNTQVQGNVTNEAILTVGREESLSLIGNTVSSNVHLGAPNGVARLMGNTIQIRDSPSADLTNVSGDTTILFQSIDDIFIDDIADSELTFASGIGKITLAADINADGNGNVVMQDVQDRLSTNGRDILISGANLVLGTIETSSQQKDITVVDIDQGGPIPAIGQSFYNFLVPDGTGRVEDIDVRFSAEHTWNSDLVVTLEPPFRSEIAELELFNGIGSDGNNFQDTVIDDESQRSLASGEAPFAGRFRPQGEPGLAIFDGGVAEGNWTLTVQDTLDGFAGTVFKAGDDAPWGRAIGTQLIVTSSIIDGRSGSVDLQAAERLTTNGIDTSAPVNGGDIRVAAQTNVELGTVTSGAQSFSYSVRSGNAGNITISSVSGDIRASDLNAAALSDSRLFPETRGIGNGGDISIRTAQGNISVGAVNSRSLTPYGSPGEGGAITLSAPLGGITTGELDSSSVTFLRSDTGNAGEISIDSGEGDININGPISADTFTEAGTSGNGGNITISSDSGDIILAGDVETTSASLFANTGDSGSIRVSSMSGDISLENRVQTASRSITGRVGNGGDISVSSVSGDITISGELDASSFSPGASSPNSAGGAISLQTREGTIVGNGERILTFSVLPPESPSGVGGQVTLNAEKIADLEVVTLSSTGESGNVLIESVNEGLTVEDLELVTAGQLEVTGPRNEKITLILDDIGPAGNTTIQSVGDIDLNDVIIQSDANGPNPAGNVTVSSPGKITFIDSQINSNANSEGAAGEILIDSARLDLGDGARIFAATLGSGNGGSIVINASESVLLGEGAQNFEPIISVEASGSGRPGNIVINTPDFVLSETARITATSTATSINLDDGGSITLSADRMNLAGTVGIFAETQGQAAGGVLTLQPYQSNLSLIQSQVISADASLRAGSSFGLTLAESSLISASTTSSGNGGGLRLLAPESITIRGPGRLAVETSGSGQAGNVTANARSLTLSDGVVLSASTTGGGNAGNINLNISDQLTIDNSTVESRTFPDSTGQGGNINVRNTGQVSLLNGGNFTLNSTGTGEGGDFTLSADILTLDSSQITAITQSSNGGDFIFNLDDYLLLRNSSLISTEAGTASAGGNGGSIAINIPNGFIIAIPEENSDIRANAFDGDGGTVNITARNLLGIDFRPGLSDTAVSDITSSSEFGNSGTVTIDELNSESLQPDVELPVETAPATVARGCRGQGAQTGSFVSTGRGGLPTSPIDPQSSDTVWQDLAPLDASTTQRIPTNAKIRSSESTLHASTEAPIVEAQGWTRASDGSISLVAEQPDSSSALSSHTGGC